MMKTFCITNAETDEVIACICDEEPSIVKNGYKLSVYENYEPVFSETEHGVVLKKNSCFLKL